MNTASWLVTVVAAIAGAAFAAPVLVFAHANFLGNMQVVVEGATVSTTVTLPEAREVTDQQAFESYTRDTLIFTNEGVPCPISAIVFTPGNPAQATLTSIALSAECPSPVTTLNIHSEYFLDEGYSFSGTVISKDESYPFVVSDQELDASVSLGVPPASAPWFTTLKEFVVLGIRHIYTGLDHLLFIAALIIGSTSVMSLLGVITAFTLAHSLTLALAAFHLVSVAPVLVEPLIALSIAYVALAPYSAPVLARLGMSVSEVRLHRWRIVAAFGLIHGLGFASALLDINLPRTELPLALFAFNVGVEVAQLVFIIVVAPLFLFFMKRLPRERVVMGMSLLIGLVGVVWFIVRVFSLAL